MTASGSEWLPPDGAAQAPQPVALSGDSPGHSEAHVVEQLRAGDPNAIAVLCLAWCGLVHEYSRLACGEDRAEAATVAAFAGCIQQLCWYPKRDSPVTALLFHAARAAAAERATLLRADVAEEVFTTLSPEPAPPGVHRAAFEAALAATRVDRVDSGSSQLMGFEWDQRGEEPSPGPAQAAAPEAADSWLPRPGPAPRDSGPGSGSWLPNGGKA